MKSLRTRTIAIGIAGLLVSVAGATGSGAAPQPEVVPTGFTDTVFARVPAPTALAATPDGRKLVTEQSGRLRVIKFGFLLATPALDISAKVCANIERGLLGVAVDPHFVTNGFVYLYYTFRKFADCAIRTAQVPVNRVSRFTMTGDTINPASEKILIGGMPSFGGNHNAGFVGFGKDGMLYISVGDGGCDYTGTSGCAQDNDTSRRRNTPLGKVLRITSAGGIPADNPFTGPGTVRCNLGAGPLGTICQETFLRGLRNPFKLAFHPDAKKTRFYVNDVGQNTWEEIDRAERGSDYGWNVREGFCATGSTTDCGRAPAGLTNPVFAYGRSEGCTTITGGVFVPKGVWPAKYDSRYLFGDFGCGKIFGLVRSARGDLKAKVFAEGLGGGGPVALLFAVHGTKTSLFYTTFANGGEVHVIDKV
jgi:glucose/arabinose dehydrogenase